MADHDLGPAERAWAHRAGQTVQPSDTAGLSIVLDLVAVVAGHKPAALIQSPGDRAAVSRLPDTLLSSHALAAHPHWLVPEETAGLPGWYADAIRRQRTQTTVHIFSALPFVPPTSVAAEATLLAYPLCCATEFYRRRRLHHLFTAKRIRHFAGPDQAKATAYVMSEVALTPATPAERAANDAAMTFTLAPHTGVAMCRTCVANPGSPARRMAASYRSFARAAGIEDLLSTGAAILSTGK